MANNDPLAFKLKIGTELKSQTRTYVIKNVLGYGGFGISYMATSSIRIGNIPQTVRFCIKEFFPRNICRRGSDSCTMCYKQNDEQKIDVARAGFLGEATRLAAIQGKHPSIVAVNEVFEQNNTVYYVMEYLDGGTLESYVQRHKNRTGHPLCEDDMLTIMHPIVAALAYLHNNRITHLDVKPANIMVVEDENSRLRPVLIDFGLSRRYQENGLSSSDIDVSGYSTGYAPPEQYSDVTKFSPEIDVYAVTATMLYCLTGKHPGDSIDLTPDGIEQLIPQNISPQLYQAIIKGMQLEPEYRYANAEELLKALPTPLDIPTPIAIEEEKTTTETQATSDTKDINKHKSKHKNKPDRSVTQNISQNKRKKTIWRLLFTLPFVIALLAAIFFIVNGKSRADTAYDCKAQDNGYLFTVNDVQFKMIKVDGGTFMMGADSTETDKLLIDRSMPATKIQLSDFYIGETVVTQGLWKAVMGQDPPHTKHPGDNYPVTDVSIDMVNTFIDSLNKICQQEFMLPTEAQWEYAARGGNRADGYMYAGSDDINAVAWYLHNSDSTLHEVKKKNPNELKIYDMSGNVYEWCRDQYTDRYFDRIKKDPAKLIINGKDTIVKEPLIEKGDDNKYSNRGGGFKSEHTVSCRVNCRKYNSSSNKRDDNLGFRLVLKKVTTPTKKRH